MSQTMRATMVFLALGLVGGVRAQDLPAEGEDSLEVEGVAALDPEAGEAAVPRARDAAIADALRLAVEQRMGVYVEGSRTAENYLLVRYRLETHAEGLVRGYEVLEEEGGEGIYWVRLRVRFHSDAVEAVHLDTVRVAVLVSEKTDCGGGSGEVAAIMEQCLSEAGFRVTAVRTGLSADADTDRIRTAAGKYDLDLVVLLACRAERKDELAGLLLYRAVGDLKVVRPRTGDLLATRRITETGRRKPEAEDAAQDALANLGKAAASYLLTQVVEKNTGILETDLYVSGIGSRWQVDSIRKMLFRQEGVQDVDLRSFQGNVARLTVRMNAEMKQKLGYYVEHLGTVNLRVRNQSPGWIEAKVYE